MENKNDYYFSSGVFFTLINDIRRESHKTKIDFNAKKKLGDIELMLGLYELFYGELPSIGDFDTNSNSSFSVQVSKLKNCVDKPLGKLPFANADAIDKLIQEVETDYNEPLLRTIYFIDNFLTDNNTKQEQFIKKVMEILRKDKSVKKGSEFYVKRNGVPISKKEVLEMKTIEFDPFVLGILHYVIKTHPENTKGRSLIEVLVNEPTKKVHEKNLLLRGLSPKMSQ